MSPDFLELLHKHPGMSFEIRYIIDEGLGRRYHIRARSPNRVAFAERVVLEAEQQMSRLDAVMNACEILAQQVDE
jgi:hypothetical protein